MKFKSWVIAVSLAMVLALGGFSLLHVRRVSESMLSMLEQVRIAVASGDWGDAENQANVLHDDWHRRREGLQVFISHRDTDAVDMTLVRLIAAIQAGDSFGVAREIANADTALENLPIRETPYIANIL